MIVSMMYSIKTRKIRRNKIRLHDWSVKEHQERGSDLISSGYGSFDLPINLSFNGVDSVSRHGNRSSTAFDLECSVPLLDHFLG